MLKIIDITKPARVTATATALVEVIGRHTRDEVIDFALEELGETRTSVFGYGIRTWNAAPAFEDMTLLVYAYRD